MPFTIKTSRVTSPRPLRWVSILPLHQHSSPRPTAPTRPNPMVPFISTSDVGQYSSVDCIYQAASGAPLWVLIWFLLALLTSRHWSTELSSLTPLHHLNLHPVISILPHLNTDYVFMMTSKIRSAPPCNSWLEIPHCPHYFYMDISQAPPEWHVQTSTPGTHSSPRPAPAVVPLSGKGNSTSFWTSSPQPWRSSLTLPSHTHSQSISKSCWFFLRNTLKTPTMTTALYQLIKSPSAPAWVTLNCPLPHTSSLHSRHFYFSASKSEYEAPLFKPCNGSKRLTTPTAWPGRGTLGTLGHFWKDYNNGSTTLEDSLPIAYKVKQSALQPYNSTTLGLPKRTHPLKDLDKNVHSLIHNSQKWEIT